MRILNFERPVPFLEGGVLCCKHPHRWLDAACYIKYKLVYQMMIFQDRCAPRSQSFEYRSATTTKQIVGCICRERSSDSFGSWCRGSKVLHIAKVDHSWHNVFVPCNELQRLVFCYRVRFRKELALYIPNLKKRGNILLNI